MKISHIREAEPCPGYASACASWSLPTVVSSNSSNLQAIVKTSHGRAGSKPTTP